MHTDLCVSRPIDNELEWRLAGSSLRLNWCFKPSWRSILSSSFKKSSMRTIQNETPLHDHFASLPTLLAAIALMLDFIPVLARGGDRTAIAIAGALRFMMPTHPTLHMTQKRLPYIGQACPWRHFSCDSPLVLVVELPCKLAHYRIWVYLHYTEPCESSSPSVC